MNTKKAGIGAGLAAGVAAGVAAGDYFYASKNAKRNRKIAAKWANDLKNDVARNASRVAELDKKQMLAIIDRAAATYETVRGLNRTELSRAVRELKKNWENVIVEIRPRAKKVIVKSAKKRTSSKKRAR